MLNISLNTGMRRGEILQIGDTAHWDSQSTAILLPKTKNGDDRVVPLNEQATQSIKNLDGCPKRYFYEPHLYDAWAEANPKLRHMTNTLCFMLHVTHVPQCWRTTKNVNTVLIGTILIIYSRLQLVNTYIQTKVVFIKFLTN